ncbi:MAG: flagellar motor switch protein FliN, partial [Actinomycetota bacterium]|nr:flagellar motor switch protein FliN [Actinomycetota bacterium]
DYSADMGGPAVILKLDMSGGSFGGSLFAVMAEGDGVKVSELAQQQDLTGAPSLDDMGKDVLREAFNQLVGEVSSNLTVIAGGEVSGALANLTVANPSDESVLVNITLGESFIRTILELVSPEVTPPIRLDLLTSDDFASQLSTLFEEPEQGAPAKEPTPGVNFPDPFTEDEGDVPVAPAFFDSLQAGVSHGQTNQIDLLLDISLNASIELGRTTMTVSDVLNMGIGSVIELDKLASEPVDFLVNGKMVARGEVVVIEERFGIRITDIVNPRERLESV